MVSGPATIKGRALQWLAQREHSRNELRDKLLRWLRQSAALAAAQAARGTDDDGAAGPMALAPTDEAPGNDPAADVEALLQWLEAHGYLSTPRFVESRVHARQARYGNLRIRQELQQHGIELDGASQQALQQSEHDRALGVWRKRFGTPADNAADRLRQMRFLAGRGFSLDVVRQVVGRGGTPADED